MGIEFKITKMEPAARKDVAVFQISGWLDAQNEARLVDAVREARAAGAIYAVLDLRDLDTITSAGIRAIQASNQLLASAGESGRLARVKLCNASPRIYEVLSMMGLLQAVPTYESVDIAVAACK